jgi:hypothetical protein
MGNMKAKDLIQSKALNETDDPPPETTGGQARINPRRPMPGRSGPPRPGAFDQRGPGMGEPPGQFTSEEKSQLKDVLIQILASAAGSQLDAEIGQTLMGGQDLNPNQLQHIIDESRRIKLPASHNGILQKIFSALP